MERFPDTRYQMNQVVSIIHSIAANVTPLLGTPLIPLSLEHLRYNLDFLWLSAGKANIPSTPGMWAEELCQHDVGINISKSRREQLLINYNGLAVVKERNRYRYCILHRELASESSETWFFF